MRSAASAVVAVCASGMLATACGGSTTPAGTSTKSANAVTWQSFRAAPGVVDLAGPRSDGRLVAGVASGLSLFGGGQLAPFTSQSGKGAYAPSAGESYVALTPEVRLPKSRCSFHRDNVFAIGANPNRIVRINRKGKASNFTNLPSAFLNAIAFDQVGTFGHRLLVTGSETRRESSTLYSIDCRGRVKVLAGNAPLVEGGMEVAPKSFGRFGGRLIAVDEFSGRVYAFKPSGQASTVATPSLATGADIGVESLGFVPRLKPSGAAFLADHGVPGAPHPGTDSILRLSGSQLRTAGVSAGDLLIATEASANTVAIRCRKGKPCNVRAIGDGPSVAHAEGHIAFLGVKR
jgi:hypothetical protein